MEDGSFKCSMEKVVISLHCCTCIAFKTTMLIVERAREDKLLLSLAIANIEMMQINFGS